MTFPICSADEKLRARIADFALRLDEDAEAKSELEGLFASNRPEVELFRLLLRLKGMEIYFGRERAALLARRLGLARVPEDGEMRERRFCMRRNGLRVILVKGLMGASETPESHRRASSVIFKVPWHEIVALQSEPSLG